MKWGVRRGRAQQAYEKASRKLDRYDQKYSKLSQKVNKKVSAAAMSRNPNSNKAIKRKQKIQKMQAKMLRNMRKSQKWYNKMEKTFKNTPVQMTSRQKEIGRRYTDAIRKRSEQNMIDYMGR